MNRRQVLAGAAALPLLPGLPARRRPGPAEVALSWLEGKPGAAATSTWGTPWPQGSVPGDQTFRLAGPDGGDVPVQSWPLAYWPDGTLKWSAHAVATSTRSRSARVARY